MATFKITGFAESTVRAYFDLFTVDGAEINDEIDMAIDTLAQAYDPKRSAIAVDESDAAEIVAALTWLANGEDEAYERERTKAGDRRDPECMNAARHAARGLSTLSCNIVKRFGAACYT